MTPVAVSVQRKSTPEPCSDTNQDPAPAASHTPDPLTNVQREHPGHLNENVRKGNRQVDGEKKKDKYHMITN